jgi:hypothetical protein
MTIVSGLFINNAMSHPAMRKHDPSDRIKHQKQGFEAMNQTRQRNGLGSTATRQQQQSRLRRAVLAEQNTSRTDPPPSAMILPTRPTQPGPCCSTPLQEPRSWIARRLRRWREPANRFDQRASNIHPATSIFLQRRAASDA